MIKLSEAIRRGSALTKHMVKPDDHVIKSAFDVHTTTLGAAALGSMRESVVMLCVNERFDDQRVGREIERAVGYNPFDVYLDTGHSVAHAIIAIERAGKSRREIALELAKRGF